ncbi:MAG: FAD-binding oxidoreductase [Planctomycetaceae bacterium]|nr:FAD-binding oxidoreductase [Planctomycetaceae bacterium]
MTDNESTIEQLRQILGDRLSIEDAELDEHAKDVSHHEPQRPIAVAHPESTEEVAAIVGICSKNEVPIIPFGTATAVEGGVVAIHGGVSIDLRGMNRILRVAERDMDATVEAGVTRVQLNEHLSELSSRLHFPVDPGADASLGGMAATRASGTAAVKYGTMRENVLALKVVLADGSVIETGTRVRKSSAGYDLTHLMVGSEGTLGIITGLTLKLTRLPEAMSAAVCAFPDIESAVNAVIDVMSEGVPMARVELLDEVQMDAVNRYSGLDYQLTPTLFFEFHGSSTAVVEDTEYVMEITKRYGAADFQWAYEEEDRQRLWQARHDGFYATLGLREGSVGYVTDVCVPVSQLAEAIMRTKRELESTNIPAPLFGHVGDGNFHVVFPIDPNSPEELAEVQSLSQRIVDHALELDGTCSGEHGIGIGKLESLKKEHGAGVDVMRAIKRALDPNNIMNPGKVIEME